MAYNFDDPLNKCLCASHWSYRHNWGRLNIWNVISTMSTHEYPDIFSIIVLIITVHTILLFVLVTAKILKISIRTIANSVKHFRSCNPDNK